MEIEDNWSPHAIVAMDFKCRVTLNRTWHVLFQRVEYLHLAYDNETLTAGVRE